MRIGLAAVIFVFCVPAASFAQARLSPADEAGAFRAAGFTRVGKQWKSCKDGSDAASYVPGAAETVRDIDGDGLTDAVLTEGSAACYGDTGESFWLVSKQTNGSWKLITSEVGVPTLLPRAGAKGWPDIEIGGPGFCFPVQRWNGRAYTVNRYQYEGKPCKRR